jgi:D-alanyl-D-alanine carboxypeptidase (penicillin-binding protein 5/6)
MAATVSRARVHRSRPRAVALGALLLAGLVALIAIRLLSEPVPQLRIQRLLAASVPIRGPLPKFAWPTEGQAAVEVEGIGDLGTFGPSNPAPIASVAKIMTAYLTLREHPLLPGRSGFVVTLNPAEVAEERERAARDQSVLPVRAGERLSERQALQALLLPSANNIAALLAIHDAGSTSAFLARMNAAARALGMSDTVYTDPSGYQDSTVSTAADQLRLAAVAMRIPTFATIVDEASAVLPVVGEVDNYDDLVGHDDYVGIKTGSDSAAGGCLVFARRATVAGRRLLILGVVLGQRQGSLIPAALASAQRLGDSVADALRDGIVVPAGARVLLARGVDGPPTGIVLARTLHEIGWGGLLVPVTVSIGHRPQSLAAGQQLATVSLAPRSPSSSRAVAAVAIAPPSLGWRLRHLL